MARSSSVAQLALEDAKRLPKLQACGRHTKSSTIDMLMQLQKAGALEGNDSERQLRRKMQVATEAHSKSKTPYGAVVQQVYLGLPDMAYWEVCHPFAWLYYMTSISASFAALMMQCVDGARPLRLVIYADELNPGNPFRPERSRTLMCIYWSFVDWPAHILSRTFAWPCFSLLRSSTIKKIDGGMSYLARSILRIFFPLEGPSLERGIFIQSPHGAYMVKAIFAGWLCDLLGHKEVTEWKGTSGNVCCLECGNLHKAVRGGGDSRGVILDCVDKSQWGSRSNEEIFAKVDELDDLSRTCTPSQLEAHETRIGFNHCPNGLLLDKSLRTIYKPANHTIRDWQHTLTGDGVANTCIADTLHAIAERGYTLENVQAFMDLCVLPSKYGGVHLNWLSHARLKKYTLQSFSSTILTLCPIIMLFLEKYCHGDPELEDILRCFTLLYWILGLLGTGAEVPTRYVSKVEEFLEEFHEIFALVSRSLKPKLHHMRHIVDGILWLGKSLSCFVTERKHRSIKAAALHVFRHIEHTVLADVINKQCEQMVEGMDLFKERFLVDAREVQSGLMRSRHAVLACGSLQRNDVVWLKDSKCGRINTFYECDSSIIVDIDLFANVDGNIRLLDENRHSQSFVDAGSIVDACIWYYDRPGVLKVCVPVICLFGAV